MVAKQLLGGGRLEINILLSRLVQTLFMHLHPVPPILQLWGPSPAN